KDTSDDPSTWSVGSPSCITPRSSDVQGRGPRGRQIANESAKEDDRRASVGSAGRSFSIRERIRSNETSPFAGTVLAKTMRMRLISALLLFFLAAVSSCSDAGSAVGGRAIEPNLFREDPASYPDDPIPNVPPVIACPYESTNGC